MIRTKSDICVIGIDPGKDGGVALFPSEGNTMAWRMPHTEWETSFLIRSIIEENPTVSAFVEQVNAFKKSSSSRSFKFGRNYGFILGCLHGMLPVGRFETILPCMWMRESKCLSGGNKALTKALAQHRHPHLTITHMTAEALLLAEAGQRILDKRSLHTPLVSLERT